MVEAKQYMDRCLEVRLEQSSDFAGSGESVDLHEWGRFFAYDIVGELFFSKMVGFLEARHDHSEFMHLPTI